MRKAVVRLVLFSLVVPSAAFADDLPVPRCVSYQIGQAALPSPLQCSPQPLSHWQSLRVDKVPAASTLLQQQPTPQRGGLAHDPVFVGALIGMGSFATLSAINYDPTSNTDLSRGQSVLFAGIIGAGLGALAGLVVKLVRR